MNEVSEERGLKVHAVPKHHDHAWPIIHIFEFSKVLSSMRTRSHFWVPPVFDPAFQTRKLIIQIKYSTFTAICTPICAYSEYYTTEQYDTTRVGVRTGQMKLGDPQLRETTCWGSPP